MPAMVAASSGSAMLAGIHLRERTRDNAMRASMTPPLSLRFPSGLEPAQALAALDGLAGLPHTTELIAEVAAREGSITHALWVPAAVRDSVQSTMTGAISSLRITEAESSPADAVTLSLRLFVPTPSILSDDNAISASRSLLTNLAGLRSGEQVVIRVALRPGSARPRRVVANPSPREREIDRAWQRKSSLPGFSISGLVLIRASQARARELATHIENVLRGRRGLVGGIRVTSERGNRRLCARPCTTRSSGWVSNMELLPILAWPQGADVTPGVELGGRELRAASHLPKTGRKLFVSRSASGEERPVALDATAARHHMAVIGPSGVGKSVLLTRAILSDIEHGFSGAVIDPKSDLIDTILSRVKPEHADRIVVLDPGDTTRPTPGIAVLSGGDPDSRADVLTGTLKSIFGAAWGVRSEFYGRLAIRTLSEIQGASLADMGRLFYEEPYRRAAVARLRDPFLLSSWQAYEGLSDAAKAEHVQAPMARVMTLLSRPKVRAVLASPEPKLDIAQLFRERKWLLVSLAPGVLSEAGAALVGSAAMYSIWSAIEARVALPPEKRFPIFVTVDELATVTNGLPSNVELIAERARGLGAGLTVALQTVGRVGEPTRSALIGNLATMITFRAGAKEAPGLAMEFPGLSAADLQALGRFEVAARVGTGSGSAVSVVTGRTEPLGPVTGQAEAIRDASARRYGASPEPAAAPTPAPVDAATEDQGMRPQGRTGRQA
jgi:DNA helicase HerA-like ATPase